MTAEDTEVEDPFDCDIAIVGSFAVARRAILSVLREKLEGRPAILLVLPSAEDPLFDGTFAAISPAEMHLLPHVVRRETELHHAVQALRISEERNRQLIDNLSDAVWRIDKQGQVVFATANIEKLTGFSIEELTHEGMGTWWRHVHPADSQRVIAAHAETFHAGWHDLEYRFSRKDGQWIWLRDRAVVSDHGDSPEAIGTLTDMTDRRLAEQALRKSEERYRSVVEQATEIIFSTDPEGRITSLNPAFESLTGWPIEEWIGVPFVELVHDDSARAFTSHFGRTFHGAPPQCADYHLRRKNGEYLTIETSVQVLVLDGQPTGIVGVARDSTRRQAMEAELEKEKRLAGLGHLAASVAHEFNNVLMSILPFAELLRRRAPDDERVVQATTHIIEAVRRGRQVSQEIFRLARPPTISLVAIDAQEWLTRFVGETEATLGPNYQVRSEIEATGIRFLGDRALVERVAANLITNAREAMPDGGTVTISVRRLGHAHSLPRGPAGTKPVEISIHDSGGGIAQELIDHIFDPLFTTKSTSSGLGLSIAHQAMTQQDGLLSVRSEIGKGSTFSMIFRDAGESGSSPT